MSVLLNGNGHANGRANRLPVDLVMEVNPAPPLPPATRDLTPLETAVHQVLTDEPQPTKVLSRLAGRSLGRVREAVASLCNKELAQRTPKGIRLAGQVAAQYADQAPDAAAAVIREVRLLVKMMLRMLWSDVRQAVQTPRRLSEPVIEAFRHSKDFRGVNWNGNRFQLSKTQAAAIEALYLAHQEGVAEVHQEELLRKIGSSTTRLTELFRRGDGARAWGTLIVQGETPGTYRLDLPGGAD